jgi:excisionase family DNA binding protein
MPDWELFKIKELADLLQLNQQTVRNMVNRGELEYVKVGRTTCIPRTAAAKLAGGTGMEVPELLTVAQVAELLQLNRQTLWNWIGTGTFPAVQIGERLFRIKRTDLDAWLNARPYASAKEFWGEPSSE